MRYFPTTIIILACIGGGLLYYSLRQEEQIELPFETVRPTRRTIVQKVNAGGTLKAETEITIGSLVDGRVMKVLAENNDVVKKGQVLVELDNGINYSGVRRAKGALERARANLSYQQAFHKRQEDLYRTGQISKDSFELVTSALRQAKSEVEQLQGQLEIDEQEYNNTFIRAPEDGIVIARKVDLGQTVTSRLQATVLYTLATDLSKMEVTVDVDEADIGLVKEGQAVEFSVDAFPRKQFDGTVKELQFQAKTVENVVTYPAILQVANPELLLRPGMTADVDIIVRRAEQKLSLPNKAFRVNPAILQKIAQQFEYGFKPIDEQNGKDKDTVWVFADNAFVQKHIVAGARDHRATTIDSGLEETDAVVIRVVEPRAERQFLQTMFRARGTIGS